MGCGKSTVGIRLAALLDRPFVDLDAVVEKTAQCSVDQIFADGGEEVFRDMEAEALRNVADNAVCALGGGAILHRGNLEWARREGFLIYLEVTPDVLRRRLVQCQTVRPLLNDVKGQRLKGRALERTITRLLKEREVYYRQARAIVPASDDSPDVVAQYCADAYSSRNESR